MGYHRTNEEPKSIKAMEMRLIQLDDSWFDTMVKQQFFSTFKNPLSDQNQNKPLWNQMHEFVSAEKHYYSLIKQTDDFYDFDGYLYNEFAKSDFTKIKDLIETLNKTSTEKNRDTEKRPSSLEKVINIVQNPSFSHDQYIRSFRTFIFNEIIDILSLVHKDEKLLLDMRQNIPPKILEQCKDLVDIIVSTFKLKSGYKPSVPVLLSKNVYDENGIKIDPQELEMMSNINNIIKAEHGIFPGFYIYVCPKEGKEIPRKEIMRLCAKEVCGIIHKCIEKYLTDTIKIVLGTKKKKL